MAQLNIPIMKTAPGSFLVSPIERVFGYMNSANLLNQNLKTLDEVQAGGKEAKRITEKEVIAKCVMERLDMLTEDAIIGMLIASYRDIGKYIAREFT